MCHIAAIALAMLSLFGLAHAQMPPAVKTEHASSHFVSERTSVRPGATVTLALLQELDPHWHVYWENPGDSGLPLTLDFTAPDGVTFGQIQYPTPQRIDVGPLVNFGHEGQPGFLVDLTAPATARVGDVLRIAVAARWLICSDICVPEDANFTIDVPVTAEDGAPGPAAARIADARAAQPQPAPFTASWYPGADGPVLVLDLAAMPASASAQLAFFPSVPALIEPAAPVQTARRGTTHALGFVPSYEYNPETLERLDGVVVITDDMGRAGFRIVAGRTAPDDFSFAAAGPGPAAPDTRADATDRTIPTVEGGLGGILLLAVLGGLVLNIMPCVFPVVVLKALSFAGAASHSRATLRLNGLTYLAGVLTMFAGLGLALFAIRAGGAELGWGFHLQSPRVIAGFALLLFVLGLNLAGVFELGTSVQGVGQGLTERGGASGSFFTGLLAVAVAAPCVGPFLGGALGAALSRSAIDGMLIFLAVGVGLALPYVLFSFVPGLARLLPRPGAWMEGLRRLLAFGMFGSAAWLLWVLSVQAGSPGVLALGIAMVVIAFAAWIWGASQRRASGGWALRLLAAGALAVAIFPLIGLRSTADAAPASNTASGPRHEVWSPDAVAAARAAGEAVFVEFTAAWCVSCQVNKRTVLDRPEVAAAFLDSATRYFVADWTSRDDRITAALADAGRAGVPLYLYYAQGAQSPVVLPQWLGVEQMRTLLLSSSAEGSVS